jgi:flagellar biosynthesis protein FlhF
MNDVRTYRAASMQEALDIVRREMGGDAVILHTRQVAQRRFLPWTKPVEQVEITAGLGVNIRTPARPAAANRHAAPGVPAATRPRVPEDISGRELDGVVFERTTTDAQVAGAEASLKQAMRSLAPRPTPAARPNPQRTQPQASFPSEFATKLDSIQKMLQELGRGGMNAGQSEVPPELFHLYTNLIDAEVEDAIAKDLITRLKQTAGPEQLHDADAALTVLTAMVERQIRCSGPIAPQPGKRKVVALVGSTGVGKTTTIAKLAANFRLRDGVKMGLVTVDTYRIAAVEQLRTYAEIIDLPMKVVTSPPEMRRALDELAGLDLVLIDTAGRSPRDELQIQELKSLLAEAIVDEVHLVMNMTASAKSLEATAQKFAAAGTTSLIMTKLDEAAGMGALLSVARKVPLPFSYLTTGQDVPDDIESAIPTRIARLILGREKLQ